MIWIAPSEKDTASAAQGITAADVADSGFRTWPFAHFSFPLSRFRSLSASIGDSAVGNWTEHENNYTASYSNKS